MMYRNICKMPEIFSGELGYPIRVALNGKDALRLIRRQRPSVVLLDVSMEGMNGFQVCRAIRAEKEYEDICCYLCHCQR